MRKQTEKDESVSIENQKRILEDYAQKKAFRITGTSQTTEYGERRSSVRDLPRVRERPKHSKPPTL